MADIQGKGLIREFVSVSKSKHASKHCQASHKATSLTGSLPSHNQRMRQCKQEKLVGSHTERA